MKRKTIVGCSVSRDQYYIFFCKKTGAGKMKKYRVSRDPHSLCHSLSLSIELAHLAEIRSHVLILPKEPYTHTKEPYRPKKEPFKYTKEPYKNTN